MPRPTTIVEWLINWHSLLDTDIPSLLVNDKLITDTTDKFEIFNKAFDRVWIKGLLHKLQQYGITGNLHHWFQSYLTGRKQRGHKIGCNFSWANLSAGVPQGSVIGPLLFLIYINDMTYVINTNIHLFADDATLFSIGKDVNILHTNLQHDLLNIQKWVSLNIFIFT